MNLVIDAGNTRVKAAIFIDNKISEIFYSTKNPFDFFKNFDYLVENKIKNIILSSVINHSIELIKLLKKHSNCFIDLNENTPLPIQNKYKTPKTLGKDRLANGIAGHFYHPKQNTLIIDAGTCIKFDFINDKNDFIGGAISPGFRMRFKALHTFTGKLPLIDEVKDNFNFGTDTESSLISGVYNGMIKEIEGVINQYNQQYKQLNILFTGGDAHYFVKYLKNSIFADAFLTIKGLNALLNYNVQNNNT